MVTSGSFPGAQRPRREPDYSCPRIAMHNIEWSFTSLSSLPFAFAFAPSYILWFKFNIILILCCIYSHWNVKYRGVFTLSPVPYNSLSHGIGLCSVIRELPTCYMKISTLLCWETPAGKRNTVQLCYSRVFALPLHTTPTDFQNLPLGCSSSRLTSISVAQ